MFPSLIPVCFVLNCEELVLRKSISKNLFLVYCLLGGMYYEKSVRREIRFFWILYNVVFLVTAIVGSLTFLLVGPLDVALVLTTVLNAVISLYATIILPSFTYYFRHDLTELIKMIDDDYAADGDHEHDDDDDDIDYVRDIDDDNKSYRVPRIDDTLPSYVCRDRRSRAGDGGDGGGGRRRDESFDVYLIVAFQSAIMLTFAFTNPLYTFAFYDDDLLKDPFNYVFFVPFIDDIDSRFVYVAVYSTQIFLTLYAMLIPVFFPAFLLVITGEIGKRCDKFCRRLRRVSQLAVTGVELLNDGRSGRSNCRRSGYDVFVRQMTVFVEWYRRILRFAGKFKPFMDINVSIFILVYAGIQLAPAYIVMATNAPLNIKVKELAVLLCTDVLLYVCCVVGKVFTEINNAVKQEVYSTPWYYLPAEHRRFVHLFLCEVNHPLRIFAMRILPISMDVFPKMIRIVYSYINFLHKATVE